MSQSITSNAVAIATPDLEIIEGQITTTSNQVAEHFGKRHADVIRAIRKLDAPAEFTERNFALSEFTDSTGRVLPAYRITRDGFTLLAMGFTGKEAMQWKVAYLTAFNQMEAELLARTTRPHNPAIDYDRISPAQAQDLKEIVATIVQAGIQSYGETWSRLQRKFKVNSYLELPATQHLEARAYLLAKLPKARADNVVDEAKKPAKEETLQQTVTRWVELIERTKGYPVAYILIFQPLVDAINRKMNKSTQPLPGLKLSVCPPAIGQYRYNPANPHPANGRTIEVAKSIAADIRNWSNNLPAGPARHDLHDAAQTLYDLLVSGWTEVDEALGQIHTATHYLNRWQGRGGYIGNCR